MSISQIIFYFFGLLTVVSAINILLTKNVLHAAFSLMTTFIGVAAIFIYAGADFIAVVQVLVYIGGVLVLLLFGIMLTHRKINEKYIVSGNQNRLLGFAVSIFLFITLLAYILKVNFESVTWIANAQKNHRIISGSTIEIFGQSLMTNYILPFEVIGLILMVALMGAAFIAQKADFKK